MPKRSVLPAASRHHRFVDSRGLQVLRNRRGKDIGSRHFHHRMPYHVGNENTNVPSFWVLFRSARQNLVSRFEKIKRPT